MLLRCHYWCGGFVVREAKGRVVRLLFGYLFLCVMASSAWAGGLPFARYGLLDTPSAHFLGHTEITLAVSGSAYSYEDSTGSLKNGAAIAGFIEAGVFDLGQIGGTYLGEAGFSGTARVLALRETINRPGIAVGVENITSEENYEFFRDSQDSLYSYPNPQNFSIYGVVTKDFSYFIPVPVCLNIGFGTGRFQQSADAADGFENPIPGLFGSLMFHPTISSEVIVEWDGRDLNLGGMYRLNRRVTVLAAATELEHFFVSSDSPGAGQDVMQHPKFTIGLQVRLGPFLNRTELDPYQRLRYTEDDEALRMMEEYRARAREEIREMENTIR
jgi:hypothetical protein